MRRALLALAVTAAHALACGHVELTPQESALVAGGDCEKILRAADAARIRGDVKRGRVIADGCSQDAFNKLLDGSEPAAALVWCGRAGIVAGRDKKPSCDFKQIGLLKEQLKPKLSLGPPDPSNPPDRVLTDALGSLGDELNLIFAADPDVIIGKIQVNVEEQTTRGFVTVSDPEGHRRQVPSVNHRRVARCQAQVELLAKTRTLRASEETRSVSWEAVPRWRIPAHPGAAPISDDELKKRAVLAWLRAVAKALWLSPPETVDTDDDRGCVAYGLALNAQSGDSEAAAMRKGDTAKIDKCEPLVDEPRGGGIPVP